MFRVLATQQFLEGLYHCFLSDTGWTLWMMESFTALMTVLLHAWSGHTSLSLFWILILRVWAIFPAFNCTAWHVQVLHWQNAVQLHQPVASSFLRSCKEFCYCSARKYRTWITLASNACFTNRHMPHCSRSTFSWIYNDLSFPCWTLVQSFWRHF